MEKNLEQVVEEILHTNELAAKRLSRKVYSIIFGMIFILTTIIIVEFKEYSNNYQEYKIGLNELGPKDIVWAGIMGTPPRYYESNEKYGLGYREFDTREIRKALEDAGINLVYRYMSPNRLEFEFERKHPICFYDRKWSNPKEYFKKKRHPILSIPLYYSGDDLKYIFFRKGERSKFEKHLDSKGNIVLESLIKDTSLKTELIRKVEYDGPYAKITYQKRQLDGTYYDYIKKEYQQHIDLVILHTNDQIIQMLKWRRFDYQFFDTLEYDDYPWMDGGEKGIETLPLSNNNGPVLSVDDPKLIFHSVACGNHPLSKMAMPIINEVIKTIRLNRPNYARSRLNELKLNPKSKKPDFVGYVGGPNRLQRVISQTDHWYLEQFSMQNKEPWPLFNIKNETLEAQIKKNRESLIRHSLNKVDWPHWNLLERKNKFGEISLIVINDTDIKNNSEKEILRYRFLDIYDDADTKTTLDRKTNFSELDFSKINSFNNIIIFARGIKDNEFELFKPSLSSPQLKEITLIESSFHQSKNFLSYLPKNLEKLRLFDVPLMGLFFSQTISKLKNLKCLDMQAAIRHHIPLMIEKEELMSVLLHLPNTLETLSIVGIRNPNMTDFPLKTAEIFSKKKFPHLKNFTLLHFYFDDQSIKLILDALPLELESLIIGAGSSPYGGISSLHLEDFLKARRHLNKLHRLRVSHLIFSHRQENKIYLPESLKDFWLNRPVGLNDGNFQRIIIPEKIKFKNLLFSSCNINDYSILKLLKKLDIKVERLQFDNNKLTGYVFFLLKKHLSTQLQNIEIEELNLRSNPINDFGIFSLSKLSWKIRNLDLSNTKLTDNSTNSLISNPLWVLESLYIGSNFLNTNSINTIMKRFSKNLREIYLENVLGIDFKMFSQYIHPQLESLSVAGNMINDNDISYLAPKLPKNLKLLDISGSRMSAKGALLLAKNMIGLSTFNFDFKFGEDEEGLKYIFQTLSPYIMELTYFSDFLSYKNVQILKDHLPPFLYSMRFPEMENEECKELLAFFPHSLRLLIFDADNKSKGFNLKELAKNFPSQLLKIIVDKDFEAKEIDSLLSMQSQKYLHITNAGYSPYSHLIVEKMALFYFLGNGAQKAEYFKGITLPAHANFYSFQENDIPSGFLHSFHKDQLKDLRTIGFITTKNIDRKEIIEFIKKLPKGLLTLGIGESNLLPEDVDTIISILPKNLKSLGIHSKFFGETEKKKFMEFKRQMEEKTGLPFDLRQ